MLEQYKQTLRERFFRYVQVPSESDPRTGVVPSTESQREFARLLRDELEALGLQDIQLDEHAILTARLPATVEGVPTVG